MMSVLLTRMSAPLIGWFRPLNQIAPTPKFQL